MHYTQQQTEEPSWLLYLLIGGILEIIKYFWVEDETRWVINSRNNNFVDLNFTFAFFLPRCWRKNLRPVRLLPIQVLVAAGNVGWVPSDLLPVTSSNTLLYGGDCPRQLRPHSSSTSARSNSTFPTSPKRFREPGWRDPQHDWNIDINKSAKVSKH